MLDFELSEETINNLKKYKYISIHAPWKELRYDKNKNTIRLIDRLREISEYINIKSIVLHPDIVDNFSFLDNCKLPFLLENMDKRKRFGIKLEHFEKLKENYNFGFLFDAKHAYEHDSSMKLGFELIDLFGDRLKELHVSGEDSNGNHNLVYSSKNKEKIEEILKLKLKVPIILEGILSENFREEILEELNFLKNY